MSIKGCAKKLDELGSKDMIRHYDTTASNIDAVAGCGHILLRSLSDLLPITDWHKLFYKWIAWQFKRWMIMRASTNVVYSILVRRRSALSCSREEDDIEW